MHDEIGFRKSNRRATDEQVLWSLARKQPRCSADDASIPAIHGVLAEKRLLTKTKEVACPANVQTGFSNVTASSRRGNFPHRGMLGRYGFIAGTTYRSLFGEEKGDLEGELRHVVAIFGEFLFVVTAFMRLSRKKPDESGHYELRERSHKVL